MKLLCTTCGHIGEPKRITKGHFFLELVLWLCFLVPGFIYSIWRLTSRHDGCEMCGAATLIPTNSPMAARVFAATGQVQPAPTTNAGYAVGKGLAELVSKDKRKA